jgi:hypothetical protein
MKDSQPERERDLPRLRCVEPDRGMERAGKPRHRRAGREAERAGASESIRRPLCPPHRLHRARRLERYTYSAFGTPTFYNAAGTQIGASALGIKRWLVVAPRMSDQHGLGTEKCKWEAQLVLAIHPLQQQDLFRNVAS